MKDGPNLKKNIRIVFPADITSVISEIMKSNGIKEDEEESFNKILDGKSSKGEKMAEIIKKAALKEILSKDLSSVLAKSFDLPQDRAKKFADEIEKKVLNLAQKISEESSAKYLGEKKDVFPEEKTNSKPSSNNTPSELKTSNQKDVYREIAE